ncbi:unnamed protein product [Clonostachys rhizophaga]|uniref:Zn(2)-C6 fungal-type domain-containing protein n=1 Tax=Clonostachys rhizophaga TaxID=160324 RepID=A0A9N9VUI6_9HYPO|nr:unnamed protein product [Clonostachys rhizophaga]
MTRTPRQKACMACADSKRRCDKQLPECQRCLDKGVSCVYPQSKRRPFTHDRRNDLRVDYEPMLEQYDQILYDPDFGGLSTAIAAGNDNQFSDLIPTLAPILPSPESNLVEQAIIAANDDISSIQTPWFLQDETWQMQHCDERAACVTYIELEPLIRAVEGMLVDWIKDGYNSFIHRRLYRLGMPTYLQDAFTTLATYISRAPAVKDLIIQIAMDRLSTFVNQRPSIVGQGAKSLQAHLARVQTLFIYEFILLFDGSVGARASGQRQLPILRQWVTLMQEAVRSYRGENGLLGQGSSNVAENEFDREYNASTELWHQWVLTESIRRTQVIVNTICNIYEIMVLGSAECTGGIMFTARHGLWEAESAFQWLEISRCKLPLIVPSLRPSSLMSQYNADEVDDFVKLYWTFLVGNDRVQCWIDRDKVNIS